MNHALDNPIPLVVTKLPVLIVAFCRARNVENVLQGLLGSGRRVYIVIDKATEKFTKENNEVILSAKSFEDRLDLTIHINENQAGVKMGVPNAIDFVFGLEEACIILEDDCTPMANALDYFDKMSLHLSGNVSLVSGDSPWSVGESNVTTTSSYPLIWGWVTNRTQWEKLKVFINAEIPWIDVVRTAIRHPRRATPLAYFLAAQIRIRRGKLEAWDCSVALAMLTLNLKCIVPNVKLILNAGNDEFAHHTFEHENLHFDENMLRAAAQTDISLAENLEKYTDEAIERKIYKMTSRQIISPIKALLEK